MAVVRVMMVVLRSTGGALGVLLPPAGHQSVVTGHAEDALGGPRIPQILNLLLAVPAAKAAGTKGLIARQDGQILDLVPARAAAVGAIVADEGAIAEEKEVGVGVEQGAAGIAPKAVNVPTIARCRAVSPAAERGGFFATAPFT